MNNNFSRLLTIAQRCIVGGFSPIGIVEITSTIDMQSLYCCIYGYRRSLKLLSLNKTLQLVQLCPSLQGFSLTLPPYEKLLFTTHSTTNESVDLEKLTITRINSHLESTSQLVNFLSSTYPNNIKQLHLIDTSYTHRDFFVYLDIPNTRLDILLWDGTLIHSNYNGPASDFKVYIRLKANKQRVKHYTGSKLGLSLINTRHYKEAKRNQLLCFNITCQSLTELRIKATYYPGLIATSNVNFNLTF